MSNFSDGQVLQYTLAVQTELADTSLKKLEGALVRSLNYAEQLTGDPNLKRGIRVMESAITTLRSLRIAIRAVQAAAGPVGWFYAGTTALAAGISYAHLMTSIGE